MGFKQRVENHPIFFVGGLMVAAFVAGWGGHSQIGLTGARPSVSCVVNGLPDFSSAHAERLATLQAGLVQLETRASDDLKIPSYQERYADSADRVRRDIAAEQQAFNQQLQVLHRACR